MTESETPGYQCALICSKYGIRFACKDVQKRRKKTDRQHHSVEPTTMKEALEHLTDKSRIFTMKRIGSCDYNLKPVPEIEKRLNRRKEHWLLSQSHMVYNCKEKRVSTPLNTWQAEKEKLKLLLRTRFATHFMKRMAFKKLRKSVTVPKYNTARASVGMKLLQLNSKSLQALAAVQQPVPKLKKWKATNMSLEQIHCRIRNNVSISESTMNDRLTQCSDTLLLNTQQSSRMKQLCSYILQERLIEQRIFLGYYFVLALHHGLTIEVGTETGNNIATDILEMVDKCVGDDFNFSSEFLNINIKRSDCVQSTGFIKIRSAIEKLLSKRCPAANSFISSLDKTCSYHLSWIRDFRSKNSQATDNSTACDKFINTSLVNNSNYSPVFINNAVSRSKLKSSLMTLKSDSQPKLETHSLEQDLKLLSKAEDDLLCADEYGQWVQEVQNIKSRVRNDSQYREGLQQAATTVEQLFYKKRLEREEMNNVLLESCKRVWETAMSSDYVSPLAGGYSDGRALAEDIITRLGTLNAELTLLRASALKSSKFQRICSFPPSDWTALTGATEAVAQRRAVWTAVLQLERITNNLLSTPITELSKSLFPKQLTTLRDHSSTLSSEVGDVVADDLVKRSAQRVDLIQFVHFADSNIDKWSEAVKIKLDPIPEVLTLQHLIDCGISADG